MRRLGLGLRALRRVASLAGMVNKREKRFLEAVKASNLVSAEDLERSLEFQAYARERGRAIPLDRILLKFEILDHAQIAALYQALRFFTWRKEDKLYAKIAEQSQLLTPEDAKRCLKEQKRAFQERRELKRLNEIAREKGLLAPKEDRAIIRGMRKVKPRLTILPLDGNPLYSGEAQSPLSQTGTMDGRDRGRGPARKGEEEAWKKDVRARELAELNEASQGDDLEALEPLDDVPPRKAAAPSLSDDDVEDEASENPHLSQSAPPNLDGDDFGDPLSTNGSSSGGSTGGRMTDEDLDPLWAEADLDDVELDSEQRSTARNKTRGSSSDLAQRRGGDDDDLFD